MPVSAVRPGVWKVMLRDAGLARPGVWHVLLRDARQELTGGAGDGSSAELDYRAPPKFHQTRLCLFTSAIRKGWGSGIWQNVRIPNRLGIRRLTK